MSVEWRPVHDGVAGSAVPAGVAPAAVAEAGDVADEDLAGAEQMPVGYQALIGVEVLIRARSLSALVSRTGGFPLVRVRFTFRRAG